MVELFISGGPVMWPLLGLSILALAAIAERCWYWRSLLKNERQTIAAILEAARQDLAVAGQLAREAGSLPIGRFLAAPLSLENPDPELFRLALESHADEELADMLHGEKLLESVIALAPLLGLLGTVTGLIVSFSSMRVGDIANNIKSGGLTQGLAQALITTATGLGLAIATLTFHRTFLALHAHQVRLFRKAGNELELTYRTHWQHRDRH